MRKQLRTLAIAGAVLGLGVAACGTPPEEEGEKTAAFKACMVSDVGGFDDKGFNENSHKGLTDAVEELDIDSTQLESQADADYPENINTLVKQDCDIIVTVGFLLADATYEAAKKYPDVDFAIVDNAYDPKKNPPLDNLKSLVFNTAEPSFLAGYLAAGTTKTNKVGTFGGVEIPTVTIFMDGFWQGVQYYNDVKGGKVQVLGWDETKQNGSFTGDFEDKNKGKNTASNLMSQGADVIFPVAGPVGLGALEAVKGDEATTAIWVDTDGCESASEYCPELLTSAEKRMDVAVKNAITDSFNKEFDNSNYVGTLDNDGVALSPYHDFDAEIPGELKAEIEQLQKDIIDGKVEITSPSQPAS